MKSFCLSSSRSSPKDITFAPAQATVDFAALAVADTASADERTTMLSSPYPVSSSRHPQDAVIAIAISAARRFMRGIIFDFAPKVNRSSDFLDTVEECRANVIEAARGCLATYIEMANEKLSSGRARKEVVYA